MQLNDENLKIVLSKNIKSARLSSNFTQDQLAKLSNISVNFLKDIEQCRSTGSLLTFVKLCKSLEITPTELLKDFFCNDYNNSENLLQQINLLNNSQKDLIFNIIQYFNTTDIQDKL